MALQTPQPATTTHLEDQAATAALYATGRGQATKANSGHEFLDSNHRLSSAGAATSLKYANPQDLPSFPSSGLKASDSAAGAAASLGWANQKPFEHWKPDPSTSASVAAMRAKDYKMAPLWHPEQSANGAKAAILAHRDSGKTGAGKAEASPWGNSAAMSAFKKYGAGGLSPVLDYGYSDLGRKGSLLAATGAMSHGRRRAESTPVVTALKPETYPDERNSATNALRAAESASRKQKRVAGTFEQGAIPYTALPREMFTSHPPVAPEVEEMDRRDTLHASAVAMARGMYNQQQKKFDAVSNAPGATHARRLSSSTSEDEVQPTMFGNLQEAAQKLANARLAKLHDEHAQNREYRDYYTTPPTLSRLTGRGRTRRRAASDGGTKQDKEQSNKIRAQMSQFSSDLSQVDAKKRQQDRDALIAAAQRNVTKKLHGMDERVYADTGKVPPSLLSEWEVKAHAAAQEKSDTRMENYGKVHIGGGKYIDQSVVDKVAQKNVQPVLDDINEKAEAERERQAGLKLEQENEARMAAEKKARDRESKEINKRLKQQDKEVEKARKEEEKNAKKEEARLAKEKRKSGKYEPVGTESVFETEGRDTAQPIQFAAEPVSAEPVSAEPVSAEPVSAEPVSAEPLTTKPVVSRPVTAEPAAATGPATGTWAIGDKPPRAAPQPPVGPEPTEFRTSMEDEVSLRMRDIAARANGEELPSPDGKLKKWFKNRISRRLSRASEKPVEKVEDKGEERDGGFLGGAALAGAGARRSTESLERPGSVRDVALAGKAKEDEPTKEAATDGDVVVAPSSHCIFEDDIRRSIARGSQRASEEDDHEARDMFDENLAAPPTFPVAKEASPSRDSKFIEQI